jgi:hypothetical protein
MSRQITIDAVRAFNNSYKFKRDNTEVRIIEVQRPIMAHYTDPTDYSTRTELRLHGSVIAYKNNSGVYISNCGYKTVTTKERLNGLSGVHIQQKNFVWYLNDKAWDGSTVKVG